MASDVEVLREMLAEATERARESADLLAQYPSNKGAITGAAVLTQARVDALTAAISALEARGAQPPPKVAPLTDERVLELQEGKGAGRIDNPDYATAGDLDSLFRDHLRARASERAWEAKWQREKEVADANVAIASSLRTSLAGAQKRIEELEKRIVALERTRCPNCRSADHG